jgi:hypothetical protein
MYCISIREMIHELLGMVLKGEGMTMKRSILILVCSFLSFGLLSQPYAGEPQGPTAEKTQVLTADDFKKTCVKDLSQEPVAIGDFTNVSIGPSVAAQVLRYDLASKQAAFNTGVGAGISARWYGKTKVGGTEYSINQINSECRADTLDAAFKTSANKFKVGYLVAVSPFLYVSKVETSNDLNVQPAIQLSFLSDLLTVGTGFNLTGTDKGHVFLLMSLGWGFKM